MFEATFAGHQGWVIRTERTCILADVVLGAAFGHGATDAVMWPPREIDFARFPPIDAVFFSHEHSDHFCTSTLARIDRKTPILLPARASRAAHAILEEMGFRTYRLMPGDVVAVGDLELHVFSADQVATDNADEWDVLPFAVKDVAGDGSFACFVNVPTPAATEKLMVEALGGKVGIYAVTNNAIRSRIAFYGGVFPPENDSIKMVAYFADWYARFKHAYPPPEAVLICGCGFAFREGPAAWMNRNLFVADNELIAAGMAAALPGRCVQAVTPGVSYRMEKGRLASVVQRSDFLGTPPRATWPDRTFVGDVARVDVVESFLRRPVTEADLPEIEAILDGFAGFLYASATFRALYSVGKARLADRKPTFAFVLRVGDGAYVFEWEQQGCQFIAVESRAPAAEYVCGAEMWACDLLAVARGEIEWVTAQTGYMRAWNMAPDVLTINNAMFMTYFAALRRPDIYLKLYRTALSEQPKDGPRLRLGGARVEVRGEGR